MLDDYITDDACHADINFLLLASMMRNSCRYGFLLDFWYSDFFRMRLFYGAARFTDFFAAFLGVSVILVIAKIALLAAILRYKAGYYYDASFLKTFFL